MNNRVVITGIGVISPNGIGTEDFHQNLFNGKSAIRYFPEHKDLNFRCHIGATPTITDEYKAKLFDEFYQKKVDNKGVIYACLAGFEAWQDAGLEYAEDQPNEDVGIIFGTGALGMDSISQSTFDKISSGQNKRLGTRVLPEGMSSGAAAYLNKIIGAGNRVQTNSSACITGSESILLGYDHLKHGKATQVLCGSTEGDGLFIWGAFDAMRVLCSDSNDNPTYGSRPMSASSTGFIPGSGSGAMVLETLESARARGAKIYAEILGGEVNSGGMRETGTMTAPNSNAVVRCIKNAMKNAAVKPEEIDLINGHLTSTRGDTLEIKNWRNALELNKEDFPYINTPKSMIGHCVAGAGSVELVASVLQLKHGFIHKNLNLDKIHPDILEQIPAESIPTETIEKEIDTIIKANFGFGDLNCVIVLRKWKENG
ncbi:MAG: beta-ketoacyl-[acyl-carrier-protein] synthase family protein [Cyclobacteriaceae bacterium]